MFSDSGLELMNRRNFLVTASGLAAAVTYTKWGAVGAPITRLQGSNPLSVVGLGTHSLDAESRGLLKQLGITHLRHTLYPNLWEEDSSYPRRFRRGIEAAVGEGFAVLLVVHPVPRGFTARTFATWIGQRARQLPGVEAWQIGNEVEFEGGMAPWHVRSYGAIKEAAPSAKVVTMGFDLARASTRRFLEARPPLDAFCFHVYGPPLGGRLEYLTGLARGVYDGPLWVTEFGVEKKSLREQGWEEAQSAEWQDAVSVAQRVGVERVYGYQLKTEEPLEMHGVVRPDNSLRPAARWLQARAG